MLIVSSLSTNRMVPVCDESFPTTSIALANCLCTYLYICIYIGTYRYIISVPVCDESFPTTSIALANCRCTYLYICIYIGTYRYIISVPVCNASSQRPPYKALAHCRCTYSVSSSSKTTRFFHFFLLYVQRQLAVHADFKVL
jgi:hypothetical protein